MAEVRAHYILHGKTSSNSHCANFLHYEKKTEMELLDNVFFLFFFLTKDSSVRLHAIPGFRRKHIPSGFKITSCKTRNFSQFMSSFQKRKEEGRKPDTNSILRRLEFMPRNPLD